MNLLSRASALKTLGGVEGVRLSAALALSVAVHTGAALWLELPDAPALAAAGATVRVRLVEGPPRDVLEPVPPARVRITAGAASQAPVTLTQAPVTMPLAPVTFAQVPSVAGDGVVAVTPRPVALRDAAPVRAQRPRRVAPSPPPASPTVAAPPAMATPRGPVETIVAASDPRPELPADSRAASSAPVVAPADTPPRPVAGNLAPEYPLLARRRGQEGRVVLRLQVDPDGSASATRVLESSGVDSLDRAARAAVSRWRFTPASRGGRRVSATVDVPVVFRLDGRG